MRKMILVLLLTAGSVYGQSSQDSVNAIFTEYDYEYKAEHGHVFYGNERDYDVNGFDSLMILWNGSFHYLDGSYDELSGYVDIAYGVAIEKETLESNDKVTRTSLIFSEQNKWRQAIHTEHKDEESESFFLFREIE
tara:strand:+ start:126 stop:533 length:408 start_codon:yes stop_codon:yes gene_type:complete